jgi:hypothetical protein
VFELWNNELKQNKESLRNCEDMWGREANLFKFPVSKAKRKTEDMLESSL